MSATRGRVVVVGSFNVDHVWWCDALPQPGETRAGRYATGPGGKGFNQAVAAARAGASTRFLCALGDDAGAALARSLAQADGISLIEWPERLGPLLPARRLRITLSDAGSPTSRRATLDPGLDPGGGWAERLAVLARER